MRPAKANILLHPLVITSLFVLLLNDSYCKYAYPCWLTGKLSDFTGLIVLSCFLLTLTSRKIMIIAGCALFFTWWKSVWSQPLLNYFHHTLHITVSRTIDSSDLFALPVLFIVYFIKPPEYDLKNFYTNILHKLVAIGCLFAFCNTTAIRHSFYSLRPNEVHFQIGFTSVYTEKQIIQKIKDAGLTWYKDSVRFYPIDDPHIYYQVKSTHDSTVWVQAANRNDSALFFRKESSPFYILSFYVIDGDTLKNIEFTISDSGKKKKPSYITIESFRIPNLERYENRNKAYKKYKKHFQKLFSE